MPRDIFKTMIMRKTILFSIAYLFCLLAIAQPKTKLLPAETVLLYGTEIIDNVDPVVGKTVSSAGFEMLEDNGLTGPEAINDYGNLSNISVNARIDLYFPKKPNGQMVIVCPGGGYKYTSSYNEGVYVAEWMISKGITVAVVKYRMPNGHWEIPLTDVQNAFRYCRGRAAEWGVSQIGVMGFSAGGHLAATTTNMFVDDITRPDFSVLIYPVITMEDGITHKGTKRLLLGEAGKWDDKGKTVLQWQADMEKYNSLLYTYSIDNQVNKNTPISFVAHCTDDRTVPIENAIRYYRSLVKNGVSSEMHIYPTGGHGWGFSWSKYIDNDKLGYCRQEFFDSLERWLNSVR